MKPTPEQIEEGFGGAIRQMVEKYRDDAVARHFDGMAQPQPSLADLPPLKGGAE